MNPVLQKILDTGACDDMEGHPLDVSLAAVSPEEGERLQQAIRALDAQVTVEVGLAYGVSALFICDALRRTERTMHHVIDPFQVTTDAPWKGGVGLRNLERAGYADIIRFHEKPSHQALPELEQQGVTADFVFIDGWHTFDHTLVDVFHADRILRVGGLLAIDDTDMPAVRKAVSFVLQNRAYSVHDYIPHEGYPGRRHPVIHFFYSVARRHPVVRGFLQPPIATEGGLCDKYTRRGFVVLRKNGDDQRSFDNYTDF